MKRTAAILLLFILAFNWLGYRFVTAFLERNAEMAFEDRIESADYEEADLLEFRVPLNTPYITSRSSGFERCDGQVEIKGVHYKYVKRKIENGDLVLLCIPNESRNRFENLNLDYYKLVNDLSHTGQGKEKKSLSLFKGVVTEYRSENNSWAIAVMPLMPVHYAPGNQSFQLTAFNSVLKPPPKC